MPTTSQTVRIGGVRTVITTKDGQVTTKPAPPLEWEVQAAAVRALRNHPMYDRSFTLAGDFNAGRRGKQEAAKAKATGLTPGEHDLRIYMSPGTLGLIEFKVTARVSQEQTKRHALLRKLGFTHQAIIKAKSETDGAEQALEILNGWLNEINEEHKAA